MRSIQKILSLLIVFCMVPFSFTALAAGNIVQNQAVDGGTINQNIIFVDVKNHWANDAIYDMANKGIISGYQDSTFQPEKSITRGEFAKLVALTFSLDLNASNAPTYSDVNPDKWSYPYVEATKDYMTGYYPPKGKAFFSPETKATREDVAVALVKVLGYTTHDLVDSNTLSNSFRDVNDISFGLRDYVGIATEKQLIGGYEDGTFRPEKPITRAEVATLLYRVIKSSAQDQANGPMLDVSMPETTTNGTFYVSGQTDRDAKVSINGRDIPVTQGQFKEGYSLDHEGTYDVSVIAKINSGKTTNVTKKITYKVNGPELKVNDLPNQVGTETITISGTVSDKTDSIPVVYLNNEKINVNWNGAFSKEVTLAEGDNSFTIKAKNASGKETSSTKKISFNVGGPSLKIDSTAENTNVKTVTLSGSVSDKNDPAPVVYLNDEKLYVNYSGSFSKELELVEGDNTFTFKADNKNGKASVVTKKITFNVGGPVIKINDMPETSSKKTVTISGNVTDKNDNQPTLYINEETVYVSWNGTFSKEVTLDEGNNVFTFRASNVNGKTSTVTKNIKFDVGGPVIKLSYIPDSTTLPTINLAGSVSDKNDTNPMVYLNDQKLYVSWNGSFNKDVDLAKGSNVFTFTATNSFGKNATVTKTVYKNDR